MMNDLFLNVPYLKTQIRPGDIVRLGRFSDRDWVVNFGWYEFGGNRPVCGWYLTTDGGLVTKPLQLPDLDDIFVITS